MPCVMVQGTMSGCGKSTIAAALCRIYSDAGYSVAPFKSQNMSRYTHGEEFTISRIQAVQAAAARCAITPEINPVLLRPLTDTTSMVYEMGRPYRSMNVAEYYAYAQNRGIHVVTGALQWLRSRYDIIVLEGAGSPAEINIPYDMANMRMAEAAGSPVLLVSDIERGGCFAQMAGTMALLEGRHRDMVRGFLINKFRGDAAILEPGIRHIRYTTGKETLGVIPYMDARLPAEDSLDDDGDAPAGDTEQAIRSISGIVKSNLDAGGLIP